MGKAYNDNSAEVPFSALKSNPPTKLFVPLLCVGCAAPSHGVDRGQVEGPQRISLISFDPNHRSLANLQLFHVARWGRRMKKTLLLCFIHGFKVSEYPRLQ